MLIGGLDGGNKKIALSLPGRSGKEAIIVPTVYAPYSEYDNVLNNKKGELIDSLDVDITLNINDKERKKPLGRFIVGNLAAKEEINAVKREMGKPKKGDDGLFICELATLAYAAAVTQNKFEGRVTQEYSIVTGLPYKQYKKDDNKEGYRQQFLGKHLVKFCGQYNIEVELVISAADVDCEGAGAMKKSFMNEKGDYSYPEDQLLDRILIVIDVGEFTWEMIAVKFVEDKGEIMPEYYGKLCHGEDVGIANAKQLVIDFMSKQKGTPVDRYIVDQVCRRSRRPGEIDLTDGSGTFDIRPMYEKELHKLAQSITETINNMVKASGQKGKILEITLVGGGPCALENKMGNFMIENLEEMLDMKAKEGSDKKINIADNAETANADGYLERALAKFDTEK